MVGTRGKRYAVVSCHVERLLDDDVWAAFSALQERRPGGFAVAALLRPPDLDAGEDATRWLERARETAARGPLGHHTHWTSPTHARPSPGGEDTGARVLREGAWLRAQGLVPTLFCGGGWYTDEGVAAACAELGYVDCTPRARRPGYLAADAAWAELQTPARLLVGRADLRAMPTTHTIGELARAVARPGGLPEAVVHVYLHDTDLLDRRRRHVLDGALRLLARRRRATDLDALARDVLASAPSSAWHEVARGGAAASPQ